MRTKGSSPGRGPVFGWMRGPVLALTLVLAFVLGACRAAPTPRETLLAQRADELRALVAALDSAPAARADGALLVRLAFTGQADLDVFVTAPDQETAYFANTPTRLGGVLERDVRCEGRGTRIERVVFPHAPPGRYRVGIDFPRRCDDGDAAVLYALRLEHDAGVRDAVGVIRPGEFLARVLEEVAPGGSVP